MFLLVAERDEEGNAAGNSNNVSESCNSLIKIYRELIAFYFKKFKTHSFL